MSSYCDGNCEVAERLRSDLQGCEEMLGVAASRADAAEANLTAASAAYDELSTGYLHRARRAEAECGSLRAGLVEAGRRIGKMEDRAERAEAERDSALARIGDALGFEIGNLGSAIGDVVGELEAAEEVVNAAHCDAHRMREQIGKIWALAWCMDGREKGRADLRVLLGELGIELQRDMQIRPAELNAERADTERDRLRGVIRSIRDQCEGCASGVPVSHTGAHVYGAYDWRRCERPLAAIELREKENSR